MTQPAGIRCDGIDLGTIEQALEQDGLGLASLPPRLVEGMRTVADRAPLYDDEEEGQVRSA